MARTGLKRTTRHAHLVQWYDGLQIDRTIYTDEKGDEFIKINGFVFDLWKDIATSKNWIVGFIW